MKTRKRFLYLRHKKNDKGKENMFGSVEEIEVASREEIIQYLEGWGVACYDNESTSLLREAAIETFETEEMEHEDFDASHMEDY